MYGESVDDVTAILHVREVYQHYILGRGTTTLKTLSREPFFVPGSLSLSRLLQDFQADPSRYLKDLDLVRVF